MSGMVHDHDCSTTVTVFPAGTTVESPLQQEKVEGVWFVKPVILSEPAFPTPTGISLSFRVGRESGWDGLSNDEVPA